jgi:hypothetical protein
MAGVDQETAQFYSQGDMASIIDDKGLREWFMKHYYLNWPLKTKQSHSA